MTTRTLLVSLFSAGAYGHGRLLDPITRVGHRSYENDPVGNAGSATFESDKWVCRHDYTPSVGRTSVTAGGELPVRYSLSADHVGDCAFYLSYDVDQPRSDMSWFKIANVPDCKKLDEQTFSIQLPDFLPAGNAVLRWDWYALHVSSSTPEMYVQCSDLAISAGASPTTVGEITPTYLAKDLYTAAETNAAPFRPGFGAGGNVGADGFFFSGVSCANGFDENDCACTATGTGGRGGVCGGATPDDPNAPSSPAPSPSPSPSPTPGSSGGCASSSCVPTPEYEPYGHAQREAST